MIDPIPFDVIRRVGEELALAGELGTLAAVQSASRGAYDAVNDLLYWRFEINPASVAALTLPGPGAIATDRRLRSLRRARHISLAWMVEDRQLAGLYRYVHALDGRLFPRVASVSIGPVALDQLRLWVPSSYASDLAAPLPTLLELLVRQARPTSLCVSFRLCPSDEWKRHQELATQGQYALVKRLESLAEYWPLARATYHGMLFQVPPALPCANTYEFAPHVVDSAYRHLREILAQQALEARLLRERTHAAQAAGNAGVVGVGAGASSGAATPRSDDTPGGYGTPRRSLDGAEPMSRTSSRGLGSLTPLRRASGSEPASRGEPAIGTLSLLGGEAAQSPAKSAPRSPVRSAPRSPAKGPSTHSALERRYKLLWGHDATLLPGPDWSIRPWQIALAVKAKFPSGSKERHEETLASTSWNIVNVEGGLYLQEREGADDSGMWWDAGNGVGWAEAAFVIREDLEMGLKRFLPQREGMDEDLLARVQARVRYVDGAACACCGRAWGEAEVYGVGGLEGDGVQWERGVRVSPP